MSTRFAIDPSFDPHTFTFPFGGGAQSADRKAPPPTTLYPNLADYRRVNRPKIYTSSEHMQREWDRVWTRTWTCAGRESDVATPGSYFRYDLGHESLIITRGHDDQVRALYNACQHRGRQLVEKDSGTAVQFTCPYHSWAYDLTGKNKRVTDRETFHEAALCGDLNLKQARCEIWGGFIFVNMDADAPPLLDYLGDIPELMAAYQLEDMHVVKETVLEIGCNWKVGLEAFIESYHLHVTHPQALPMLDDIYEQYDIYPNGHGRLATPLAIPSPRMSRPDDLNDGLRFLMMEGGVDPSAFPATAQQVRPAIVQAKRDPGNRFGLDYSGFTDSQILDDWNYFLYPNMTFNTHPEGVLIMRFLPHATDPEKFYYHVHVILRKLKDGVKAPFYFGVPDDADVSGKSRPAKEWTTTANPKMGEVLEQDISNMEGSQRGLHSRGFVDGNRYAERELRVQVFHAETDLRLNGLK